MKALRTYWPAVVLLVMWGAIVLASSLAVGQLWGTAAQVLFILPVFVLSLISGTWFGRRLS